MRSSWSRCFTCSSVCLSRDKMFVDVFSPEIFLTERLFSSVTSLDIQKHYACFLESVITYATCYRCFVGLKGNQV
jgi:hypothetical protein